MQKYVCGLFVSYIALESNFQMEAFLTYVCGQVISKLN